MTTISIQLSDEQLSRLKDCADQEGVSPEEFLRQRVDGLLTRTDNAFDRAARRVLDKNAELYRRLA